MQNKSDLKYATSFDVSQFAKKDDLANLNSDVDKLKFVHVALSKLSIVVNDDVAKNNLYDTDKEGLGK